MKIYAFNSQLLMPRIINISPDPMTTRIFIDAIMCELEGEYHEMANDYCISGHETGPYLAYHDRDMCFRLSSYIYETYIDELTTTVAAEWFMGIICDCLTITLSAMHQAELIGMNYSPKGYFSREGNLMYFYVGESQ